MTRENSASTPRRCSQCGEPAGVRYCDEDGTITWYCGRHIPPPPGMSEDERREYERYNSIVPFLTRHKRLPSMEKPEEREVIMSFIPDALPGSPEFQRKYAEMERWAKMLINHQRKMERLMTGCNLLTLPIVLPFAVLEWVVVRIVRLRRK